jgi:hypothetical protein
LGRASSHALARSPSPLACEAPPWPQLQLAPAAKACASSTALG